jgi:hypothetical protein
MSCRYVVACGTILIVARGRAAWPALAFEGRTPPIAGDIHLQDRGMVHETVDRRHRHCLAGEDFAPLAERLVPVINIDRRS